MNYLFLDESGDHNLNILDPSYPLFVLAGCVMDEHCHENALKPALESLKTEIFGNSNIILHYVDYTRNQNGFEQVMHKSFRENFYCKLNSLIKESDYTLLACVVDKTGHGKRYGLLAVDPYILSLEILVERFVMVLKEKKEHGVIIAESRGNQLDNELELAFLNIKINGTRFLRPKDISDNIERFIIKKKTENVAGLQLVDTLVTPIGRRYLNKRNYYLNYDVIKGKFRKIQCGKYMGYGLVIMPKKESGQPPLRSDCPNKTL
jgi:hypothetical protein